MKKTNVKKPTEAKVKSGVRAGGAPGNHNAVRVHPKVKSGVRAGGYGYNHNALRMRIR